MTRPTLSEVGEALYGGRWQTDLAHALGVNLRNVQRWASGDNAMPEGVWGDLRKLVGERVGVLSDLRKRLAKL